MPSLTPLVQSISPAIDRAGDAVGSLLASGIGRAGELASEVGELASDLLPTRRRPSRLRRAAPWLLVALVVAVVVVARRRRDSDDSQHA